MSRDQRSRPQLGRANPLVGTIRRLSRSPEERAAAGLMLAEGVRLAAEALAEAARIHEAIVSPRLDRDPRAPEILRRLESAGVSIRIAADSLLDSLHEADTHQGILLLVQRPDLPPAHLIPSEGHRALVLVACGVQDPGNMGTLVRLADAAGATGLLAAGGADPFGPKAVRASAGSIFRLPTSRVGDVSQALAFASELRRSGGVIAGAVPRGGVSYRESDLTRSMALFLGGEGAGLTEEVARVLDLRLTIPMSPRVESINVAAAAAVLLFEAARGEATTPRGPAPPPVAARPDPVTSPPRPSAPARRRRAR